MSGYIESGRAWDYKVLLMDTIQQIWRNSFIKTTGFLGSVAKLCIFGFDNTFYQIVLKSTRRWHRLSIIVIRKRCLACTFYYHAIAGQSRNVQRSVMTSKPLCKKCWKIIFNYWYGGDARDPASSPAIGEDKQSFGAETEKLALGIVWD